MFLRVSIRRLASLSVFEFERGLSLISYSSGEAAPICGAVFDVHAFGGHPSGHKWLCLEIR